MKIAHLPIAILGLLTICAYGSWYYAFGVLLDPIIEDTGWSESSLAASFSAGVVLIGLGSIVAGRAQDRYGTRPIFLVAAGLGGSAFLLAASADRAVVFALSAAVGLGTFGALGFYHVTMTAAVRTNPTAPSRAIAVLTIWGAFASAIYLPLTAWLVDSTDWRTTVRVLASSAVVMFVVAAVAVPTTPDPDRPDPPPLRSVSAAMLVAGPARAFTGAVALAGIAVSILLVYQVPVMTAAGLPLGVAATMAAIRGIGQLGGRIPLAAMIDRMGAQRSLEVALVSIAIGCLVLSFAGSIPVALAFAVIAGFGIGAYSPLQGINADQLFDRSTLGTTMGLFTTLHMLAGAAGPVAAGLMAEGTGDRRWAAVMAAVAAAAGAALVARAARPLQAGTDRVDGEV